MRDNNSNLVYSTEQTIDRKKKPSHKEIHNIVRPGKPHVTVRLDRKSRGGKTVTVIDGLQLPQKKMESLVKQLKARLGTGGAIKDMSLEIQGDHCNALITALKGMGYPAKRSGG